MAHPRKRPKGGGNPYMDDGPAQHQHGQASERRVAGELGARLNINSGAIDGLKGDSRLDVNDQYRFLFESKSTIHESMSVKKAWLDKVHQEALEEGRQPALTISFVDDLGRARDARSDWVAIPAWLFKEVFG